jgi:hypothetical protein
VLEVKSWSGALIGDAGTWQQTHREPVDNPVISATRKARKLKSLLQAQQAVRGRRVPWIDGAVFLSDPELDVQLRPEGRAHVYGPQGQRALSKIVDYFAAPGPVDAGLSKALARAIDQAGIRQSQRARTVGSFPLEMPAYQEGPGWQDFVGHHQRFTDARLAGSGSTWPAVRSRAPNARNWSEPLSASTGRFAASIIPALRCRRTSWSMILGRRWSSATTRA